MIEQTPDFKQPPWVQSPSEVIDWINATHPSKKTNRKKHSSSTEKVLRNLHVRFDLNVEQKKIFHPMSLQNYLRTSRVID